MKHLLNPSAILTVITAEKNNSGADFTAVSLKTGKDYTFNITRKHYNGTWYTYIKVEREYQNYLYLGYYLNGNIIFKSKVNHSDASIAAAWMLRQVEAKKFENLNNQIELYHLGNCLKCGKVLTDAESIRIGLGPICRG
jgi:hypothetical protein